METTLAVARNEWKYVAEVELDLDPNLPLVECDIAELNQVFLNLVVNACHAIESAREGESEELGLIRIQTRQHDEEQVELRFSDNGTGIGAEHLDRIFEQFFTTKEVGKGTGLGLASAYAIIKEHRGWIECESEVGKGARFAVYLPAIEQEKAAASGQHLIVEAAEKGDDYPAGDGETILVIEDDELVQNTLITMLAEFDYSVLIAGDGEEGLEIFATRRWPGALVSKISST